MSDFQARLSALTSAEALSARHNQERMAEMVEIIARALGFTIALACRGNGAAIDAMLAGAEIYAHSEAVDRAPLAKFMGELRGGPTAPS